MRACVLAARRLLNNSPADAAGNGTSINSPGLGRDISTMSNMKKKIKVLLVDDHPVVRKGLASCLASRENLKIVGEAADGTEAMRKVAELSPDIVLMDINMPELDGLAVTERLQKESPQVKVLVLSMHSNREYVLRIIKAGARG
jgi:CheY-like chemotaxis protein